jgi:ribosomal protein S18 acetylase RimI-like enzyme
MPAFTSDELFSLWRTSRTASSPLKPTGALVELDGICLSFADVLWPALNAAFFTRPAEDEEDAARRIGLAESFFQRQGRGWRLTVREEWLTPPVRAALARRGMVQTDATWLMGAERLSGGRPPRPELVCRRATDKDAVHALMDVNTAAFKVPPEWGAELAALDGFFRESDFAHVGWVDGRPAAAAATLVYDGTLYVVWVATHPDFRHRGYAEALMRHSYAEARAATGIERVALQSSEAGFALYKHMGFVEVNRIVRFAPR